MVFDIVRVCDLKEDEVLEVEGNAGVCGRESEGIRFIGGWSKCDVGGRDEEVVWWGDIVSELANDEGVVFSVSGLGCDVEHKGEVRYLAHTMRWLATRCRWCAGKVLGATEDYERS